jgi:hypothetical protein
MPPTSYRLEPLSGYTPTIGRLVGMLLYARHTTLAAVAGLSTAQLWFHTAEDEINHRGQMRWLRARLPGSGVK